MEDGVFRQLAAFADAHPDRPLSAAEAAEGTGMDGGDASALLDRLAAGGILVSEGRTPPRYRLSRPAAEISLLDLCNAFRVYLAPSVNDPVPIAKFRVDGMDFGRMCGTVHVGLDHLQGVSLREILGRRMPAPSTPDPRAPINDRGGKGDCRLSAEIPMTKAQ